MKRHRIALAKIEMALVRDGLVVDVVAGPALVVRVPVLEDEDQLPEDLPRIVVTVLSSGAVQVIQYDSLKDKKPAAVELRSPTVRAVADVVKRWFAWW